MVMGSNRTSRLGSFAAVVGLHALVALLALQAAPLRARRVEAVAQVQVLLAPEQHAEEAVLLQTHIVPPAVTVAMPEVRIALADAPVMTTSTDSHDTSLRVASGPSPQRADGPAMLESLETQCPRHPSPEYPALARRLREQGTVVVRLELDEYGVVTGTRLLASSGSRRLDDAGLAALARWQCHPALRNGQPVRAIARHEFEFVLASR